jgi:hypothetical protein
LEKHATELTEENFDNWIVQAIQEITPTLVQGYAAGAHYYVPGRTWKPWEGF